MYQKTIQGQPASFLAVAGPRFTRPLLVALGRPIGEYMDELDFETYSLEELQQVYHRIDRERFPDRFQKIEDILNNPEKVAELKNMKSKHDDIEPIAQIIKRMKAPREFIKYFESVSIIWPLLASIVMWLFVISSIKRGEFIHRGTLNSVDDTFFWLHIIFASVLGLAFSYVVIRRFVNWLK